MRTAFARLCNEPRDRDALTLWRRQAHTLKGSSRIVGLTHFGETAWEVEQTLNHWLRDPDYLPSSEALAFLEATEVAFRDAAAAVAATSSDLPAPIAKIVARARSLRGEAVVPPPAALTASKAVPPPWRDVDFELPQPPPAPATTPTAESDRTFRFGDRAVSRSLFEIFRVEAREHLATLARFLQNPETPSDAVVRAAHTLASICGTAQIPEMHDLARAWEFALRAMQQAGLAPNDQQLTLFQAIHAALYSDLATVENGAIPPLRSDLIATLTSATPLQQTPAAVAEETISESREIAKGEEKPKPKRRRKTKAEPQAEAIPTAEKGPKPRGAAPTEAASKTIDTALLPIFAEEGRELFTQLEAALERLPATGVASESDLEPILRLLHTLKGSARMAGALRLGDEIHQIEQHLKEAGGAAIAELPQLLAAARAHFLQLITRPLVPQGEEETAPEEKVTEEAGEAVSASLLAMSLRVPAPLIDRWVNDLSEIGIQRARAEGELVALRHATLELTENVERLRQQLRELEIQAESQLQARIQIAETAQTPFDPLELDRYTRLQELTRLLAEGVADVATLQQSILRAADATEVSLHRQARQTRDLQSEITELRAVPVATIRERLARIVAQTAETLGKRAQLTLVGGETRVDRAALERLLPALEHLVRNAVAHGIELPEVRQERGKPPIGSITLTVTAPSGETRWTLTDDGAGLDFDAILAKAREKGWVAPDATPSEAELARLIFRSGFSTAREVSPIAGRGVGMDVVQAEVTALGGRIEIASERGAGTRITLFVPTELTLVQLLLVVGNNRRWGIPTETIVHTQQYKAEVLAELLTQGAVEHLGAHYPLVGLHTLIAAPEPPREGRQWVVFVQRGDERLALWVEGIAGRQELTAKPTGPFLRRIAGMLGAVLLPDGEIALVLQPTALLQTARAAAVTPVATAATEDAPPHEAPTPSPPLILVVDDSLTVRRLTQRLLERAGYRVALAKDGQEALETLETVSPDAILSDIEMPRMDGFELLRHLRARPETRATPVIMITSRLADKHRTHAFELGANEYLGKPYQEETLLALLARYAPLHSPERVVG
jgi:chemosensory pili system protein ChpA (sensor histidine kinase/response regulator)